MPAPPIQRSPGGVAYTPWFQVLAKTRGARSSPAQRLPEVKGECSTQCLPAAEEDSPHGNVTPRLEGTPLVPSEVALLTMPPESRRARTQRSVEVLKTHVEYSGDRTVRILDMQYQLATGTRWEASHVGASLTTFKTTFNVLKPPSNYHYV